MESLIPLTMAIIMLAASNIALNLQLRTASKRIKEGVAREERWMEILEKQTKTIEKLNTIEDSKLWNTS